MIPTILPPERTASAPARFSAIREMASYTVASDAMDQTSHPLTLRTELTVSMVAWRRESASSVSLDCALIPKLSARGIPLCGRVPAERAGTHDPLAGTLDGQQRALATAARSTGNCRTVL